VLELALAEAREAEDLGVGLQRVGRDLVDVGREGPDHAAGLVHGRVLVERVDVDLGGGGVGWVGGV